MKEYLIVEIDAIPFTLHHWQILDYNGSLIADLLYRRLFDASDAGPQPNLARHVSGEGKEWTVTLSNDHYWEDGERLSASDAVAGYQYCYERKECTPLASIFELIDPSKGTNGIELLNGQEFRLFFKTTLPCIREVLSSLLFVPVKLRDGIAVPFSGRYRLSEISSDVVVLTKNKGSVSTGDFNHIIFLKTHNSRQGIKLFNKGLIDITANTSFPSKELAKKTIAESLDSCPLKLTSQLEFNHTRIPELRDGRLRNQLYNAINKKNIAGSLNDVIVPFASYTALWEEPGEYIAPPAQEPFDGRMAEALEGRRISFANYAPNFNVVTMMARQFKKRLGISVYPEPLDLETYVRNFVSGDYDMIYTLTSSLIDDPLCFLAHLCRNPLLEADHPGLHARVNEDLEKANALDDRSQRFAAYKEIEGELFRQKLFFPLFAVKSFYLKKPLLGKSVRYNTMGKLILNEQ